ncbi:Hypothetical predicted protein [Mytilus galloprovincialis]|uniref:Uncharacterized protein n=1 Tax=Mytilus galloprovincialis TaxID=29158 RepID=A0A8B6HCY3_MYTGA|nr:Hypothetical predicted protein [Mytilus galloprovincialis]
MSGNGRGAARNPSKSPPFLIIGLLVALAILGFNYWNLSSSNGSLSATNMDLQDQIRILTSKRLNEEQSKRDIERKYQLIEQRIATKDSEIKKLQEDVDKKGGDVERAENSKKDPKDEVDAFYFKPLVNFTTYQWFCKVPVGHNTLQKYVKRLCTAVGLEGKGTNHSLRASTATRLYQAGVEEHGAY